MSAKSDFKLFIVLFALIEYDFVAARVNLGPDSALEPLYTSPRARSVNNMTFILGQAKPQMKTRSNFSSRIKLWISPIRL